LQPFQAEFYSTFYYSYVKLGEADVVVLPHRGGRTSTILGGEKQIFQQHKQASIIL